MTVLHKYLQVIFLVSISYFSGNEHRFPGFPELIENTRDMEPESVNMGISAQIRQRVPFHDLDPLHVVWHGNYLKYFDIARFALFEKVGIDLYRYSMDHQIIFPITRFSMKHIVALRHNDEFTCRATVTEARYKIAMAFEIRRDRDGTICTRAKSEQLAVRLPDMEMQFDIPHDISLALGFG